MLSADTAPNLGAAESVLGLLKYFMDEVRRPL